MRKHKIIYFNILVMQFPTRRATSIMCRIGTIYFYLQYDRHTVQHKKKNYFYLNLFNIFLAKGRYLRKRNMSLNDTISF